MKKVQMNKNGVTLMSLVIYITIMFVILALIMRVTMYYTKNINDVTDTTFETEFEKFNMYMLQETQKSNNEVIRIANNSITFADDNTLSFQDNNLDGEGEIYYNDIKICEYVSRCIFTVRYDNQTSKTFAVVDITINETEKQVAYTLQTTEGNVKLPEEYQEVEFIESTGTQYINTRLKGPARWVVEMQGTLAISSRNACIVSNTSAKYAEGGRWVGGSESNLWTCGPNDENKTDIPFTDKVNIDVVFTSEGCEGTINGSKIKRHISRNQLTWKLLSGASDYPSNVRLFSAKCYSDIGNVLKFDGIPCYQKSNGEIGLYDTVTKEFYTNAGTGVFLKGEDVIYKALPDDYQKLEYIESTGTQYIETEVSGEARWVAIMQGTVNISSSNVCIVSNNDAKTAAGGNWVGGCKINTWACGQGEGNTTDIPFTNKANIDVTFSSSGCSGTINAKPITRNIAITQKTWKLLSGASNYPSKVRLFSAKCYQQDKLAFNGIPCYRKSDNEIGLYDTVTKKFYTNAGTGTFLKGNEVNNEKIVGEEKYTINTEIPKLYQKVEYIESNGEQYIDTGIKSSSNIKTDVEFIPIDWRGAIFGNYCENSLVSNSNNLYISIEVSHYIYTYDAGNTDDRLILGNASLGEKYHVIIDLQNRKSYFNGVENNLVNDAIWEGTNNLILFARTYENEIGHFGSIKMYNCKIYENNEIKADFIPCYCITDNEIGLYNLVDNQFYTNQGTGEFLKGPDVN